MTDEQAAARRKADARGRGGRASSAATATADLAGRSTRHRAGALGRGRRSRRRSPLCALVSRGDDRRDRRRALLAGDRVLRRGRLRRLPLRDRVGAAVPASSTSASCRCRRDALGHRSAPRSSRSRSASAPRSTSASTRGRACARRSSRSSSCSPGVPTIVFGYFALTFFTPHPADLGLDVGDLQRARRRDRHGRHDHPDGRVDLRGRDVGRAAVRCARAPTGSARRKLQVSTAVVVPAALSGIVAAFVLGDLARRRRDDDRADRRRPAAEPHVRPARRRSRR